MLRSVPSTSTRPELGAWNAHTRPISVDLPAPEGPTSAVTVPEAGGERDALEHRLALAVGEADVLEGHVAAELPERDRAARVVVLAPLAQQLARALEPGERLAQLRADRRDLQQRGHQEPEQHRVGEERAHGHAARQDLVPAHVEDAGADDAQQQRRGERQQRRPRERPEHVVQDAVHARGEDRGLAALGLVRLHHADARERLGQPAGHLRVDLAALAEDRARAASRPGTRRARRPRPPRASAA